MKARERVEVLLAMLGSRSGLSFPTGDITCDRIALAALFDSIARCCSGHLAKSVPSGPIDRTSHSMFIQTPQGVGVMKSQGTKLTSQLDVGLRNQRSAPTAPGNKSTTAGSDASGIHFTAERLVQRRFAVIVAVHEFCIGSIVAKVFLHC